MALKLWNGYPLIDDDSPMDDLVGAIGPDGAERMRGCVPRDYRVQPPETFAPPSEIQVIPESEWADRIKEQDEQQSSLEHIYLSGPGGEPRFVNLDQDGAGFCWAYSTGHCTMLARLRDNQPLVRLNPHSVAAIIKGGRDEGGWCGLSAQFLRENGIAPEGSGPDKWPLFSRDVRLDTPAMRASMARFKTTEDWVDLTQPVYDQTLSRGQIGTALLSNQPTALDFAWWGHSVCGVRVVQVEPGSFGWLILNSWNGWGRHGLGVIQGSKMNVMGAVTLRVIRAADSVVV